MGFDFGEIMASLASGHVSRCEEPFSGAAIDSHRPESGAFEHAASDIRHAASSASLGVGDSPTLPSDLSQPQQTTARSMATGVVAAGAVTVAFGKADQVYAIMCAEQVGVAAAYGQADALTRVGLANAFAVSAVKYVGVKALPSVYSDFVSPICGNGAVCHTVATTAAAVSGVALAARFSQQRTTAFVGADMSTVSENDARKSRRRAALARIGRDVGFFAVYESLRQGIKWGLDGDDNAAALNPVRETLIGGCAGGAAGLLSNPLARFAILLEAHPEKTSQSSIGENLFAMARAEGRRFVTRGAGLAVGRMFCVGLLLEGSAAVVDKAADAVAVVTAPGPTD